MIKFFGSCEKVVNQQWANSIERKSTVPFKSIGLYDMNIMPSLPRLQNCYNNPSLKMVQCEGELYMEQ